jgi:hypothetical protein
MGVVLHEWPYYLHLSAAHYIIQTVLLAAVIYLVSFRDSRLYYWSEAHMIAHWD